MLSERVILVHVDFPNDESQEDLNELHLLATAAGAISVAVIRGSKSVPEAKYFVGTGKMEEISEAVIAHQATLVIFNHALTPAQERNLEKSVKARVLDRTGLILDIFAQRARTFEGKLQVELAQLQHLCTRLVRGWTHLERQKGGIGLRGPGETQLETDRRLVKDRIKTIKKRLLKVREQRQLGRQVRTRIAMPTVALVGYTNAGKSTLFNALTSAQVFTANQVFATLDPTLRRLEIPGGKTIVMADTVGFIRHLPTDLVQAFRATLEETSSADLILHIMDAAHENRYPQKMAVENILKELDVDDTPRLEVYNKIDLLNEFNDRIDRNAQGLPIRAWVSATKKQGLENLIAAISQLLFGDPIQRTVILTHKEGKLRALLYEKNVVLKEEYDETGNWILKIRMVKADYEELFEQKSSEAL